MKIPLQIARCLSHMVGSYDMGTDPRMAKDDSHWWYIYPDKLDEVKAFMYIHNLSVQMFYTSDTSTCWDTTRTQIELIQLLAEVKKHDQSN